MRKYQGVISLVIFLIIVFLAGFYTIKTYGNNKKQVLEINFVSDHPIAEVNSKIPDEISVFFDKYELSEIKTEYENKISFRRIDLKDFKSVSVSNNETSSVPKMYLKKDNDILDSYINDTLNRVYYYLVPPNSLKYDNIKTFNNASTLREHIKTKLLDKSLFNNGKVLNKITILLLSEVEEYSKKPEPKLEPKPEPVKKVGDDSKGQVPPIKTINNPKVYTLEETNTIEDKQIVCKASLDVSRNIISWNVKLKEAKKLTLYLKYIDDNYVIIRDVTGLNEYTFNPKFEKYNGNDLKAGKYKVTLEVNDDKYKISNNVITEKQFNCSN